MDMVSGQYLYSTNRITITHSLQTYQTNSNISIRQSDPKKLDLDHYHRITLLSPACGHKTQRKQQKLKTLSLHCCMTHIQNSYLPLMIFTHPHGLAESSKTLVHTPSPQTPSLSFTRCPPGGVSMAALLSSAHHPTTPHQTMVTTLSYW